MVGVVPVESGGGFRSITGMAVRGVGGGTPATWTQLLDPGHELGGRTLRPFLKAQILFDLPGLALREFGRRQRRCVEIKA
jgi:hypothetical protein